MRVFSFTGTDRSVALPGKTRGLTTPSVVLISDPEIELIDTAFAIEARSFPGLATERSGPREGEQSPSPELFPFQEGTSQRLRTTHKPKYEELERRFRL